MSLWIGPYKLPNNGFIINFGFKTKQVDRDYFKKGLV